MSEPDIGFSMLIPTHLRISRHEVALDETEVHGA